MTTDEHLHSRMRQLADGLLQATNEGKISWRTTDSESKFLYSAANASAMISSSVDRDGDMITELSVLNTRGTVVETIRNSFASVENPFGASGEYAPEPWNETLDALYHAARRSALKVDSVLDELFADIQSSDGESPTDESDDQPPF